MASHYQTPPSASSVPSHDASHSASHSASHNASVFQIFTFYEAYLENFYRERPQLISAPFLTQMEALYRDGFGVMHVHAPQLQRFGSRAMWAVANCAPAQVRWALENNIAIDPNNWKEQILRAQIAAFAPDILYSLNPLDFDSKFVRTLDKRPPAVIGWRAADIPAYVDWAEFDLIVSHLSVCREQALKIGAKAAAYFHPCVPRFLGDMTANTPREFDVVFAGQWTPQHHQRNVIITAVAEACEREGFSFGLFLSTNGQSLPPAVARYNRGARWGIEMYRALRSGRVVLNAEIDLAKGEAGNLRLFETTAVGSFLLTEHQFNIERYFAPGKHIDTYQSVAQLLEKIRYYLKNEQLREQMAAASQAHIRTAFSPEVGARKLLEFGDTILKSKSGSNRVKESKASSASAVDIALSHLRAGNTPAALLTVEQIRDVSKPVRDLEFVRGICFGKMARFDEAAKALQQELSAFPDNPPARDLLAYVNSELGKTPQS